jgi:hypothetical protein
MRPKKMERNSKMLNTDLLKVLDLPSENATKGNIAANAYRVTHGGGLEGIGYGWSGQESSTDFLCSIVFSVEEAWNEISEKVQSLPIPASLVGSEAYEEGWEELRERGRDHEIADGCVPIYTYDLLQTAIELDCTSLDDPGLAPERVRSFEDIAQFTLYSLALVMVNGLMDLLIRNIGGDE